VHELGLSSRPQLPKLPIVKGVLPPDPLCQTSPAISPSQTTKIARFGPPPKNRVAACCQPDVRAADVVNRGGDCRIVGFSSTDVRPCSVRSVLVVQNVLDRDRERKTAVAFIAGSRREAHFSSGVL
jgi:hypothetical protein